MELLSVGKGLKMQSAAVYQIVMAACIVLLRCVAIHGANHFLLISITWQDVQWTLSRSPSGLSVIQKPPY